MKRALVAIVLIAVGCKDKATPLASGGSATAVEKPHVKIDGPSVTPVVSNSITFVVPKDATWWGELAFSCYAAVINLQAGSSPGAAFTQVSPNLAPAMAAADISLDHDVQAFGMFGCGEGPCIYVALTLRHPEKLSTMLSTLIPGSQPATLGKDHYTVEAPGANGPRTIHVQALPIAWPDKLPNDTWSRDAALATHVMFISGIFGKGIDAPLTMLADAQTAAMRVKDAESLVGDAHGMCVRGLVGKREFQPGYQLDHARFGLASPEGNGDPLTRMLGSTRSLDFEVELTLQPAPTEAVVAQWITQARGWVSSIATPIRGQFAAQGPLVDVMFDLAGVLGDRGFRHTLKGNALTLSWRTDRVPSTDLMAYEARLAKAMKAMGLDPNAVGP